MKLSSRILVLIIVLSVSSAFAGPKVHVPDSTFDFGKVVQNVTVSHSFWIHSVGDDTLRITRIVPGCGCTKAPVTDSVLAPGDSTRIEIVFSTKRFRGLVAKRPFFETNAGAERNYLKITADLSVDGDMMRPLVITPTEVDVSQFTQAPRRRAKFQVTNLSDREYKLQLVDDAFNNFDIELPGRIKAGETVEATVLVKEDLVELPFEQSVTFQLDDEAGSRYTVPVKRVVRIKTDMSQVGSK